MPCLRGQIYFGEVYNSLEQLAKKGSISVFLALKHDKLHLMKRIVVVIPTYNEEKYIKDVLKNTLSHHKQIVVVDDGSTDSSLKIIKKLAPHTLSHEINLGKGAAMKTGAEYAFKVLKAEAVIFMDSDGQHDPQEIRVFIKELENGYSAVLGVRAFKADMPLVRFLGNKFSSVLINLLFGRYYQDIPSGYKALSKSAYNKIKWTSQGYEVETEIAVRLAKKKIKFKEIPIKTIYHDTDKGFTILDAFRILIKLPQWIWS